MSKLPTALAAVRLLPQITQGRTLIYAAANERRAESIAHLLAELAPGALVTLLPPWDCLPYDRASPAPDILGQQMATLRRCDAHEAARRSGGAREDGPGAGLALVTTPEALVLRYPGAAVAAQSLAVAVGDAVRPDRLEARLGQLGYRPHHCVDDYGAFAVRGEVVDLFPPGPHPYRLTFDDGRIAAIHAFDPSTQRSTATVDALVVDPVTTVLAHSEDAQTPAWHPGIEHRLPEYDPDLRTIFDVLPEAGLMMEPSAAARLDDVLAQAGLQHRDAAAAARRSDRARPLPPEALYIAPAEWAEATAGRVIPLAGDAPAEAVPRFHAAAQARRTFAAYVAARAEAGHRVVLAGSDARDLARLDKAVGRPTTPAERWGDVVAAPPGSVLLLRFAAEHGFVDEDEAVTMICAADLLGHGPHGAHRAHHHHHHAVPLPWHAGDGEFALGDTVIHMEHGVGMLRSLERVASDSIGLRDTVRLDYASDADLLAPVDTLDRLWRYGAPGDAIRLDRLNHDGWSQRQERIAGEIAETARALVELARQRAATPAPVLRAPAAPYRSFTARFPYALTPDQDQAIEAVLADLASGRPMDRLVVGDVGFGKTEVALRAAAATVLAGRQVALVAPTTVLVRQHVETFKRRFGDLGIEVAQLSRLTDAAEAETVKAGLADGSVRLVVGTHAVAAAGVAFHDLGLLIVDEEQRFGMAEKQRLRDLGAGLHVLTLTATPIPRTLQAALVGLQELSVIATPPARRRPIRTEVAPYDLETLRAALLREKARGGQSFVVVPRIAGLERIAAALGEAAPELAVLTAHGRLSPDEVDAAMVGFAAGQGDVLVATSIIESGIDVPRANTIVVCGADLFGMSELHQLRGRVGRGRLQGICHLLTEGDPGETALRRLRSLAAFDRLGSGMSLSARDLDLRGAGDLVGEEQAGHLRLIGLGLYQHLLGLAIRSARGETVEDWSPEIRIDEAGSLPDAYIPDPELRLNLYARLARVSEAQEVEALAEELEDRFGPPPAEVRDLVARVRLRALCRTLGIARLDAGPKAIALDLRPSVAAADLVDRVPQALRPHLKLKGERLIYAHPSDNPGDRLTLAADLLSALGSAA